MADGRTTQCFDVVDEIEMNYENRKLRTTIKVLEELQQDLLVGLGDINKMGIGIMGLQHHYPDFTPEIEENSQVSGFCPLGESIVHLKLKPGCDDDHLYIPQYPIPKAHQEAVTEKIAEWLKRGK